jgi:hypothetical protein
MNFFPYMFRGWISDSHRITVSLFAPKIIPTCLLLTVVNNTFSLQLSNHENTFLQVSYFFRKLLYILCFIRMGHPSERLCQPTLKALGWEFWDKYATVSYF